MSASGVGRVPAFFSYYESPVKLVADPDGGLVAYRLSKDTGGWYRADNLINRLLYVGGDDIDQLTRDEFIQYTEFDRARYLRGEGPVFALYETVRAIEDVADAERRSLTESEASLISGIRRRTFVMFEEQLQRAGDPGADPSLADEG